MILTIIHTSKISGTYIHTPGKHLNALSITVQSSQVRPIVKLEVRSVVGPTAYLSTVGIIHIRIHGCRLSICAVVLLASSDSRETIWRRLGSGRVRSSSGDELLLTRDGIPRAHGGEEINGEREDIEREDVRNYYTTSVSKARSQEEEEYKCWLTPFQNSSEILPAATAQIHAKHNCQGELDKNERELDPETDEEYTVRATVGNAEPEVLQANEHRADEVSAASRPISNRKGRKKKKSHPGR